MRLELGGMRLVKITTDKTPRDRDTFQDHFIIANFTNCCASHELSAMEAASNSLLRDFHLPPSPLQTTQPFCCSSSSRLKRHRQLSSAAETQSAITYRYLYRLITLVQMTMAPVQPPIPKPAHVLLNWCDGK